MIKKFDQIIVGGGVIGCSIAYQLSKRGYRVLVLESSTTGCEASNSAAGMLGAQNEFTEEGPLFRFAQDSRRLFKELSDELISETDIDIHYVHKGILKLSFDQQQNRQLEEIAAFQKSMGNPAYILSRAEVLELEPGVTSEVASAVYMPDDGQVSAPDLGKAFFKAAQNRGAVIHENERVVNLLVTDGEIYGVSTIHDTYHADQVVIATGAFGSGLLPETTSTIPVKGECLELQMENPVIQATVSSDGCYLVPKQGGKVLVGASSLPGRTDKEISARAVSLLLEKAFLMVPELSKASINRLWTGIRPGTSDGKPYMGAVPDVSGLYISVGHYRNGILLSPITGIYMADLITGKRVDPSYYESFNAGRVNEFIGKGGG